MTCIATGLNIRVQATRPWVARNDRFSEPGHARGLYDAEVAAND